MKNTQRNNFNARSVLRTMRDDLYQSNLKRTVSTDFRELKEFMLSDDQLKTLAATGRIKRWVKVAFWLLRSMYFKLDPVRRMLILIGIILFFMDIRTGSININSTHVLAGIIIVFILMLELKDKLLAQEELQAGHSVQQALMPERNPEIEGWDIWLYTKPANEVGGDFVDFIKISKDRYGATLGDVAGKGLRAALLTSKLQSTLRALVTDFDELDKLTEKLNKIFCRDSLKNIFASLVYLDFQPESGVIKLMNAGHLPPVLIQNGVITKLQKGGPALGLIPSAVYTQQQYILEKGETLIVFSDGITEARNESGEFFGEKRFLDFLPYYSDMPAAEMGEQIIFGVDKFIGEAKAHDDVSVLILRKK